MKSKKALVMISLTLALAITGCGFKTSSEPPPGNTKEPVETTGTGNSNDIIEVSTVSPSDPY
ncbi:ABC transporter substrate-binding protein, partial [Clostridium perfringens]